MAKNALRLMGKKRGMIQVFDDKGNVVVCTIIQAEPNIITQIKTEETDGYNALQLGFDKVIVKDPRTIEKRVTKPLLGHFKKAGVDPVRHMIEARLDKVEGYTVGQQITINDFADVEFLDVTAMSKGKGYQGVIKRHHFSGGPASHGSGFHRHAGSTGMRSTPGRCLPGGKKAGHMGYERVTTQNLKVERIIADENVILVRGAVPGPQNGLVYLAPAVKMRTKKSATKK